MVKEADRITAKTQLAKFSTTAETQIIHLAKLLNIANSKIPDYLRKKIGEKISAGEVIAIKKGFFSSSVVKSPIEGKLVGLDLAKGTISLVKYEKVAREDLVCPVSGKIITVGKSALEIETNSPIFKAVKGEGPDVAGDLKYIVGDDLAAWDVHDDVEESVVLCRSVKEATLIKLQVIGAKGLILVKIKGEIELPWIQVEENVFEKLVHLGGYRVWLRPKEKQIVILDN